MSTFLLSNAEISVAYLIEGYFPLVSPLLFLKYTTSGRLVRGVEEHMTADISESIWNFRAGGLIIATSHSADCMAVVHSGGTPLGDANATKTLLDLDDEYDARSAIASHDRRVHSSFSRQHSIEEKRTGAGCVAPSALDDTGRSDPLFGGPSPANGTAVEKRQALPPPHQQQHQQQQQQQQQRREQDERESCGWSKDEGDRRSGSAEDDDDARVLAAREWLLDHEELEEKDRLLRRELARQRGRVEELYELHRVYSKATKKTFRALRGMPEPSYDAPACCYEEELDALAEASARQDAALGSSEQRAISLPASHPHYFCVQQGEDDDEDNQADACSSPPQRASESSIPQHHVDCVDEDSVRLGASALRLEEERRPESSGGGGKGFVFRMRNLDAGGDEEE